MSSRQPFLAQYLLSVQYQMTTRAHTSFVNNLFLFKCIVLLGLYKIMLGCPRRSREGVRSLKAGVSGNCELLLEVLETQIRSSGKSTNCSSALIRLFQPSGPNHSILKQACTELWITEECRLNWVEEFSSSAYWVRWDALFQWLRNIDS